MSDSQQQCVHDYVKELFRGQLSPCASFSQPSDESLVAGYVGYYCGMPIAIIRHDPIRYTVNINIPCLYYLEEALI